MKEHFINGNRVKHLRLIFARHKPATSHMKKLLSLLFALPFTIFFLQTNAQTPATYTSADIYMQLKKINVLGSVLYIAAHPDDENTRLLAYFSKEKQYRTGYLSLTRGDGGQNLIGDDQGIELGLIRTQELLAARRIDGAEQFFSRAYDFGFCKTSKEALDTWGHDKILSDVVWIIRKFQPDVIITRFPADERAGHGHHQASNILANEAFKAAADPNMFPEQFQFGVKPWQAKRILWNTFNFGSVNTTDSTQFKIDVGVYNNLLGKSYGEIASESRSQHKSQGFGVPRQRGQAYEYFLTTGGDAPRNDLMDGIDNSWSRVDGGAGIQDQINAIISSYSFEHPENSVDALVKLYSAIKQLPDGYWKNKKLAEVQQLIVECAGIFAEVTSTDEYAVQGDSIHVQFFANARNKADVQLKSVALRSYENDAAKTLAQNQNFTIAKNFAVALDEKISQPYWLEKPLQSGSFDVSDQQLIGKPQNDAAYTASFVFSIDGVDVAVTRDVQYKFTDPVKGEVYQPLRVVPAITGKFDQPLYVLDGAKQKQVSFDLFTKKNFSKVQTHLATGGDWKISGGTFNAALQSNASENTKAILTTTTTAGNTAINIAIDNIKDDKSYSYTQALLQEHKINYEHIPPIIYYTPMQAKAEKINVTVIGKNIGYIVGAGDKVPQSLQQMGYNVTILTPATITDENLKQFDAVIAGVRTYNTQDWINSKYDVLMRYVQNGGNYIVQYNTAGFGPAKMKIGPYDFSISRTRVTNENADVKILLANSSALNYPNKISQDDFKNWIQERSIYQAEQIDPHYEAPLAMHDANEPESNGSLIITKYGKGNFVYTGLVFFRELPAGVPGAYRLMANLIALPKNK